MGRAWQSLVQGTPPPAAKPMFVRLARWLIGVRSLGHWITEHLIHENPLIGNHKFFPTLYYFALFVDPFLLNYNALPRCPKGESAHPSPWQYHLTWLHQVSMLGVGTRLLLSNLQHRVGLEVGPLRVWRSRLLTNLQHWVGLEIGSFGIRRGRLLAHLQHWVGLKVGSFRIRRGRFLAHLQHWVGLKV